MDPLSVTASVIAIVELTSELISGTRDFYRSVRNAPSEIAELLDELTVFGVVLERLKYLSKQADSAGPSHASANGAAGESQKASRLPTLQAMVKVDGSLAVCYDQMLAFKDKLTKDPSKTKRSLKWPFRKEEIAAVVQRLRNLRSVLDTAIASDHLALSVESASEELSRRIFDWLSAPDPSTNFEAAREKRAQGTGIWLLGNRTFLNWKSSVHSFLWLFGKAGSGKSVLSSTAIHSLLSDKTAGERIAYFYFDFQIHDKQLAKSFLKSIIAQLFDHNNETLQVAEKFYNSHARGRSTPSIQSSKNVLREIMDKLPATYIVVDALDECEDRGSLLECFEDFCSWGQDNLHILVTSRREPDIEDCFNVIASDTLSLEDSVVDEDIIRYIRHQLHQDKDLAKWPEDVRLEIQQALLEGAQGMFRWVECQLQDLRKCKKLVHLRKTLKSLPKSLDDSYARILDTVEEDYVEDVRRILSCLAHSFYPLSIQEIADTVAIGTSDDTLYDEAYRLSEPRDILRICPGLVTTTRSTRTTHIGDRHLPIEELRLAHYSVKEYLVSGRTSIRELSKISLEDRLSHETLATLCVRYLLWCHRERLCEDPEFLMNYAILYLDRAAFAPYAAACWSRHLQAACLDRSSPLYYESIKLLTHPGILKDMIRLHPPWFRHEEVVILQRLSYVKTVNGNYYLDSTFENVPPLYYASLLGIDELVSILLDQGEDVNCSTNEGTCLSAAASSGRLSTVQILLARGAEIDKIVPQKCQRGDIYYSRSAIHEAVYGQHEEVAKILLARRADVNVCRLPGGETCREVDFNTPLQTALGYRTNSFVPLLICAGVNPNAAGGVYGTALEVASKNEPDDKSIAIIRMLLEAGADPNLTSDKTGLRTPLFLLIQEKNTRGVQLLIEHGVSSKSIDSRIIPFILRTHLDNKARFHWAIKTVMQIRPDISMEIPLVAAAKYGYSEVIEFMLQNGVSPNTRESSRTPVLHAAAFAPGRGTKGIEHLLDGGADINIHGPPFASALQAAALSGKADVVKFLLERGASVNYEGGDYGPAIKIARDRLADRRAGYPEILTSDARIERYGPDVYFGEDHYTLYANSLSRRKPPQGEGPKARIDIPHLQNADYQAVVDILLAHGAVDVTISGEEP